jgi:molybdate transport system substrate-binding protein
VIRARTALVATAVTAAAAIAALTLPAHAGAPSRDVPAGTITVSAAASLTDVLPVIARAFEKRFPGTTVRFNFAGSSALVEQVLAGAPVDVLLTASESTMQRAVQAGMVGPPLLIAKNTMAIAMPPDNPARIQSLQDLQRPGVITAVCAVQVPCGAAARDLFSLNSVSVTPATLELDVRAVLGKVLSGEVDAGIVYATDVRAVGSKVASVKIPANRNVTTTYPIARVVGGPNIIGGNAFVAYVRYTPSAQGILRAYGFARPW